MGEHGPLRALLPAFTTELATALQRSGEPDLARQLDTLRITSRLPHAPTDPPQPLADVVVVPPRWPDHDPNDHSQDR